MNYPPAIDEICSHARRLPCAPVLLPQLMRVIKDPRSTVNEIAQLILVDSALAAGTLRMANSAAVAPEEPVSDLGQAVVLLGYDEIYRLASLTALARWEEFHQGSLPWDPGAFARHSFGMAVAAEFLSERSGNGDPIAAYSAGMVSHIGRLALTHHCASYYPSVVERARKVAWEDAERAVFGYDSRDIGIVLLQDWHFPAQFVTTLVFRTRCGDAPAEDQPFLAVLHAAESVACSLASGGVLSGSVFELQAGFVGVFDITPELMAEAKDVAAGRVARQFGPAAA